MNELMKKHKAAVAQVPCPGVPTTPYATDTVPLRGPQHNCFFREVAVPLIPGTQGG